MGKEIKSENLIEAMHREMNRCRELKKEYDLIPTGFIGASIIQQSINMAEKAIEEDNVVKMLVAYEELKKTTG